MKSIIRSHQWKQWKVYASFLGVVGVLFAAILVFSPVAKGDVGGTGSGSCSDICSSYMSAWNLYSRGGTGPMGDSAGNRFTKNSNGTRTTWSQVQSKCASYDSVWVFVVYGGTSSLVTGGKGYNYSAGVYDDTNDHNPGRYTLARPETRIITGESPSTVKKHYDDLPASQKAGYTWGSNVAWFCYNNNPPWDISVTSTTDKPSGVIEVGETVTWTHKVINTGITGKSKTNKDIKWHYDTTGDLSTPDGSEQTIPKGAPSSGGYPATIGVQTSTYTATLSDYGKRLCENATAAPKTNKDSGTISSTDSCVVVSKKPKVQVLGGNISTGRAFNNGSGLKSAVITSTAKWTGTVYGSWGEYGILATGIIDGTASGAAYQGGTVPSTAINCTYSKLSFANATAASGCNGSGTTVIGNFTNTGSIPDVASQFKTAAATYVDFNDRSKNRIESTNGDIVIPGGTLEKGNWLVINAAGHKVTIAGNINYTTDKLSTLSDIPQLVIIADKIDIQSGVDNVDAWLIATGTNGTINTCSEKAPTDKLSGLDCIKKLTVNGPVMAKKLYLLRTFANKTGDYSEPAETFNLRADAMLWSSARAIEGIHIDISASAELPPRF